MFAVCSSSAAVRGLSAKKAGSAFTGNTARLAPVRAKLARRAPVAAMASSWKEMSGTYVSHRMVFKESRGPQDHFAHINLCVYIVKIVKKSRSKLKFTDISSLAKSKKKREKKRWFGRERAHTHTEGVPPFLHSP